MTQIIVFPTETGGVALCRPTGELSIEQVLEKDCPPTAIIVEESSLPMADVDFLDAWEWNYGNISVNLEKAKQQHLKFFNSFASRIAADRNLNTSIGVPNEVSDEQFIAQLNEKRSRIETATSTAELRQILLDPVNF